MFSVCNLCLWLRSLSLLLLLAGVLSACGGGDSSSAAIGARSSASSVISVKNPASSSSSSFVASSSANLSSSSSNNPDDVMISGRVTYDFVPVTNTGLNYEATEPRAVRGAVVELLNGSGSVLSSTTTDDMGFYDLRVAKNTQVRVRIKALLLRTTAPTWRMGVTDNTNNNRVYTLDGSLVNSGSGNSQRNLHAASGWGGGTYTSIRAAAPFAILDSIYTGLQGFLAAGNVINFPPLDLRWSVKNKTAFNPDDDFTNGEIGTSFFSGDAIYILGEVNADTDEYDSSVILHEWGHYIEAALSRSDTIGGGHAFGNRLDMRVAFSEGFGNAFSAMMLNDPFYRDSNGAGQKDVFLFDVSSTANINKGWYNESSVQAVLYNYYISNNKKTALDFTPILTALTDDQLKSSVYLTSIFLFTDRLLALFPDHRDIFESLLEQQNINSTFKDGALERNDGGYAKNLPVYKLLSADGSVVNVCSTPRFGKYNKLGVVQFLVINIPVENVYTVEIKRSLATIVDTDPDFSLIYRGEEVIRSVGRKNNVETDSVKLLPGEYILEVYDWNNFDDENEANNTTCFDVRVSL